MSAEQLDRSALVVFAREPIKGKVKTRLAATLGDELACEIYKNLLCHTLNVLKDSGYPVHIWLSENSKEDFLKNQEYPENLTISYQDPGDLGQKMSRMFENLFAKGFQKVVLVGSDCPGLLTTHIAEAFKTLNRVETVWGPTEDGGYYLIGQRESNRDLFSNVPWSTDEVWPKTVQKLNENGWSFETLPRLNDIDVEDDLREFTQNYEGTGRDLLNMCENLKINDNLT